jgi:hypothetical protein
MRGTIRRTVAHEDVRELGPTFCRIRTPRMRAHPRRSSADARSLEQVQRRGRARQVLLRQMKIARRSAQAAMAHQALDRMHIDARLEQMRGKGVPQGMDAARLGDAGAILRRVINAMGGVG